MAFSLRYPTHTSPTASWVPAVQPTPDHANDHAIPAIVHRMPDGVTTYTYLFGSANDGFAFHFEGLSDSERTSLHTFFAAAFGSSFEVFDPVSAAYFTVGFAEAALHWVPYGPTTWTLTLPLLPR